VQLKPCHTKFEADGTRRPYTSVSEDIAAVMYKWLSFFMYCSQLFNICFVFIKVCIPFFPDNLCILLFKNVLNMHQETVQNLAILPLGFQPTSGPFHCFHVLYCS